MRNLICVMLVVFLPLTLASQTQMRFKVYVDVDGDDAHINNVLESNLKREFRLLGDVDIVESDEDRHFICLTRCLTHNFKDGRKTGRVSLASVFYERIPDSYFKTARLADLKSWPVYPDSPSVATYDIDNLDKYCVNEVGSIDKNNLAPIRKLLR